MKFQTRLIEALPAVFSFGFFTGTGNDPAGRTRIKGGVMTAKLVSAVRAEDIEFARATVSIIAKTRRHWAMRPDRYLAPGTAISVGIGYASLTRDGQAVYE